MMNGCPLTIEQCCLNIRETYHPLLRSIFQYTIQPSERVLLAAEASRPNQWIDEHGNSRSTDAIFSCLIVVSNYRWLRGQLQGWTGTPDRITYMKQGSRIDSWMGDGPVIKHEWVTPPKFLPSNRELGKRTLRERTQESVHEVPLISLPEITAKHEYSVTHKGQSFEIVEIVFENSWVAFKRKDGEQVYSLLQLAKQHGGQIPLKPISKKISDSQSDLIDALEKLKNLREQGFLTDAEFQEAKAQLLGSR